MVCFNKQKMEAKEIAGHIALKVDPQEYTRCMKLRQQINPVFKEVKMNEDQVKEQWPRAEVPASLIASAQGLDTLNTFKPTLDGPASLKAATCQLPSKENAQDVVEEEQDCDPCAQDSPHESNRSTSDSSTTLAEILEMPAEVMIGIQEDEAQDPIDQMIVFQKNLELVQEAGRRIHALEQKRLAATVADDATDAAAALAAEKAKHTAACVDLRRLANKMGEKYQAKLTDAIAAAHQQNCKANTPQTLHVRSGKPVNSFEPQAWSAAFTEFFYGDCAPFLERPRRVEPRLLFAYLANREELEYSLESDKGNEFIASEKYKAPQHSRWDTPEFMAIFADTVRKMSILNTTRHMWQDNAPKWNVDIKVICGATVQQFEQLAAILARHGQHSMQQIMQVAAEQKLTSLLKALQYVTFQTANIPLTQGYKTSLRQLGFALNVFDGPLTIFLTTNFADVYSPITATLINGAGEPLGKRTINLLEDMPCMPTLQTMHRELAKHPMLQAELFLLMDKVTHRELLCMKAFLGGYNYGDDTRTRDPYQEDDLASTMEIGIAEFPRSCLKPLEAQGRGFTHGHEKIISVPKIRAARLYELFTKAASCSETPNELTAWVRRGREAILQAASTLQYDSAVHSGAQLGVTLRPEPFSKLQQSRSRFDGQTEEADELQRKRRYIAVTAAEPNGHLKREEERSAGGQRLHPYKQLSLRGACQSMLPTFRLSSSFGSIEEPDEFGYYFSSERARKPAPEGWLELKNQYIQNEDGVVTGLNMPNGQAATEADIAQDAHKWKTCFAIDARTCQINNHTHDCTHTCTKYQKNQTTQRANKRHDGPMVPKCRFRYFHYVALMIDGLVKYVIRRGKDPVSKSMIADGNDQNEFGKAGVPRQSPFTSTSSDVIQSGTRSNGDLQYQKRAIPTQATDEEDYLYQMRAEAKVQKAIIQNGDTRYTKADGTHNAVPWEDTVIRKMAQSFLCGCGLARQGSHKPKEMLMIIATLATAMRAANVADFYMTKYQSKAQEMLGPVIQPFIAGMRRLAQAESEPEAANSKMITLARKRIRCFIFAANRTVWYSACELAVFLRTGCTCVMSEPATKVFSGKGFAMMHECKRILNHATAAEGLLVAQVGARPDKAQSMDTFFVPAAESDTDSDASQPNEGCDNNTAARQRRSEDSSTQAPTKKLKMDSNGESSEGDIADDDSDAGVLPSPHWIFRRIARRALLQGAARELCLRSVGALCGGAKVSPTA